VKIHTEACGAETTVPLNSQRNTRGQTIMKTFRDYDSCASAWAWDEAPAGGTRRTQIGGWHGGRHYTGRRMFFEDGRIYSYGFHFCAGRLSEDRIQRAGELVSGVVLQHFPDMTHRKRVCYVNARQYGVVTDQRHMPAVTHAARNAGFLLLESFRPEDDTPDARVEDCAEFVDKALERYGQALTARLPTLWQHIDAADKFKATAVLHFRLIARGDTARRVTTKSTMRKLARARRLAVERMGRLMERKFLPVATARAYAEDSHITATAVSYRSGIPRMVAELANGARVIVSIADHGAVSSTLESAS
jgi:hypothetical protein